MTEIPEKEIENKEEGGVQSWETELGCKVKGFVQNSELQSRI